MRGDVDCLEVAPTGRNILNMTGPRDTLPHVVILGGGFGGLSRRTGKKPIIAAVDGICMGGGFEMVIDMLFLLFRLTFVLTI